MRPTHCPIASLLRRIERGIERARSSAADHSGKADMKRIIASQ